MSEHVTKSFLYYVNFCCNINMLFCHRLLVLLSILCQFLKWFSYKLIITIRVVALAPLNTRNKSITDTLSCFYASYGFCLLHKRATHPVFRRSEPRPFPRNLSQHIRNGKYIRNNEKTRFFHTYPLIGLPNTVEYIRQ